MVGTWEGTGAPQLMLLGRRGQVMRIDPFDNTSGNFNVAVAATSGAGKSLFIQGLVTALLDTGGRCWVIDSGRSYGQLCELVGGQFIEFTEHSGININPFTTIREFGDAELTMLRQIVVQAIAPEGGVDDLPMSWIEQAIASAWQAKRNDATFTDIAQFLWDYPDGRAKDMGQILFPYTKGGVYGRFFEGKSTLAFDNDFIVLELGELDSKPGLQRVVLLMLMMRITEAMHLGDRRQRKLCIIDEAWRLMDGGNAGEFIESGYRTARLFYGAFMTVTRSLDDYYSSSNALAALNNSAWTFLLRQKPDTQAGEYSEIAIRGPGGTAVGRLVVDPFAGKPYSTQAGEVQAIKDMHSPIVNVGGNGK